MAMASLSAPQPQLLHRPHQLTLSNYLPRPHHHHHRRRHDLLPTLLLLTDKKKRKKTSARGGLRLPLVTADDVHHRSDSDVVVHALAKLSIVAALSFCIAFINGVDAAVARSAGVNRPELLPKEFTPVIDAAGFLSEGQVARLAEELVTLEKETGFKLRVLAQNYPNTPGLAIKEFWNVDDNTIVFVADPSLGGNILNFNVGAAVDLSVPRSFWSRLSGKYGNMFYWQEKGEDASIQAAVSAIHTCLKEPPGPRACSNID